MPHLLGIDIGTSGTKTLICDEKGQVIATAMAEHSISSPKPGWSEQDPRQWWAATIAATKAVLRKAKLKGADIGGIGLSGQMHGSVFWAKAINRFARRFFGTTSGRPRSVPRSKPRPAVARADRAGRQSGPNRFHRAKILWVRQHEPKVYERTRHILLPKDYIRYCLTGEYATEVSDASGTLLLDVVNRKWSDPLLQLLEIDKALLPRLHESYEVTGTLNAGAAAVWAC